MSGFDRIKPPDQRMLEREESRQPDSGSADTQGRAGLFSMAEEVTTPGAGVRGDGGNARTKSRRTDDDGKVRDVPTGSSLLQVECGHCGISCPLSLGDAVRRSLPLVVLAPWKSHPVFATCPCGERRAWLKPRFGLPR